MKLNYLKIALLWAVTYAFVGCGGPSKTYFGETFTTDLGNGRAACFQVAGEEDVHVLRISDLQKEGADEDISVIKIPDRVDYRSNVYRVTGMDASFSCSDDRPLVLPEGLMHQTVEELPVSLEAVGKDREWFMQQPDGLVYAGLVVCGYKGDMRPGTRLVLKKGTTCIMDFAFRNCTNLVEIEIPKSVVYIGEGAFKGCLFLKKFKMADRVSFLGPEAFMGCVNLSEVKLSDALVEIQPGTFGNCESLQSVVIPKNVLGIMGYDPETGHGTGAFANCINLVKVKFAKKVSLIQDEAFKNCSKLEAVCFPKSICNIGEKAFDGCVRLKDIKFLDSRVDVSRFAFTNTAWASAVVNQQCVYLDRILMKCDLINIGDTLEIEPGTIAVAGGAIKFNREIHLTIPASVQVIGTNMMNKTSTRKNTITILCEEPPFLRENDTSFEVWDCIRVPVVAMGGFETSPAWKHLNFTPIFDEDL